MATLRYAPSWGGVQEGVCGTDGGRNRNYRRYDVSTVLEKWRSIRLVSARISSAATTT
jgi:hypothetical protein